MKKLLAILSVVALVSVAGAAELYNNGPLVTHPGQGFNGRDASACMTALGESIYGYGHAKSSGYRVADDFSVPSGGWTIENIVFFAYQTGSGENSTINEVNLRIWNGKPGGGGQVIWGDTTTNRLASTGFSNIYRVLDTGLTAQDRKIMRNVATVNEFLPQGTYWLDWQTGGTLSSGPWAPPESYKDKTHEAGANALQSPDNGVTWAAIQDSGSATPDDFPFIINGIPEPASLLLIGLGLLLRRR